ncbi:uncharacterized protein LOC131167474 [Malania oleifera]|uniref:uncharacterized protein LOC131167474 n=1 Tax=Malania oleifera TaxID=397392 RepID=UPI0025AEC756|nr:uncharacterized protein LOC131167474 [Malania oleifera]
MSPFPCPLERTAASALLLLSTNEPRFLSPPNFCSDPGGNYKNKESSVLGDLKSCSSYLSNGDRSREQFQVHKRKIINAAVARCREMKLKLNFWSVYVLLIDFDISGNIDVLSLASFAAPWLKSDEIPLFLPVVRKSRSRNCRSYGWKPGTASHRCASAMSTEGSCLSSGSSGTSSARSWITASTRDQEEPRRKSVGSAHIRRRAEAILRLLSCGCASEVRIRQMLGDSPDTSKALRMLLKLEEVKRSGAGGRTDPYIYRVAQREVNVDLLDLGRV